MEAAVEDMTTTVAAAEVAMEVEAAATAAEEDTMIVAAIRGEAEVTVRGSKGNNSLQLFVFFSISLFLSFITIL